MNKIKIVLMNFKNKTQFYIRNLFIAISLIVPFVILILINGCSYYKVTTSQTNASVIEQMQMNKKYIIVHLGTNAWHLKDISLNDEMKEMSGFIEALPENHQNYLTTNPHSPNRYKTWEGNPTQGYKVREGNPTQEVHVYISKYAEGQDSQITVPLSAIKKIEIYDKAVGAIVISYVLTTIVVIAGALAIAGAIAAATCNCPQVYIENNGAYQFKGGMYSGAVYASLERTDYMPLDPLNIENKLLKIRISNSPQEEQFINKIHLIQASHKTGNEILVDRHGRLFSFNSPIKPVSAINNNQIEFKKMLEKKDGISYGFNEDSIEQFSSVLLTFKKNRHAKNAKLIIRSKNSLWSGYIYKNFNSLFGESLDAWKKIQDKAEPKVMEDWLLEQALPLMVYIKKDGQWIAADYFSTPGNTAERDMIMNIDLTSSDNNKVELKLQTAYRFWDLDFAAMDFSENNIIKTEMIDPVKAEKSFAGNERHMILANDQQYSRLTGDESIELQFNVAGKNSELSHSYFLACSGYYHSLQKYSGKPNTTLLMEFKKKGAFSTYSRAKYTELNEELKKNIVAK